MVPIPRSQPELEQLEIASIELQSLRSRLAAKRLSWVVILGSVGSVFESSGFLAGFHSFWSPQAEGLANLSIRMDARGVILSKLFYNIRRLSKYSQSALTLEPTVQEQNRYWMLSDFSCSVQISISSWIGAGKLFAPSEGRARASIWYSLLPSVSHDPTIFESVKPEVVTGIAIRLA